MQNDFISGSLGSEAAQAIVPNVVEKIKKYRDTHNIVFTKDTHYYDYLKTLEGKKLPVEHCIIRTKGHDLDARIKEVYNRDFDYIINKTTFGYDYWEDLFDNFESTEEIEICGLCTDICVVSNALILRALFPNVVIKCDSSCCAGTSEEAHEAALRVMRSCQIEVY